MKQAQKKGLVWGLALLSLVSATAVMAEDKVVIIPMGSGGSSGVGTVVTTVGPETCLPHYYSPTTVERYISGVEVSGNGAMVLGVNAPASIDGVAYGLSTIEICFDVTAPGYLDSISIYRTDSATSQPKIFYNDTNRTTDGCYTYTVNQSTGKGAGALLVFAGGGTIRIEGATFTWKKMTELSAPAAPVPTAGSENLNYNGR